jgi:hypothetical protein
MYGEWKYNAPFHFLSEIANSLERRPLDRQISKLISVQARRYLRIPANGAEQKAHISRCSDKYGWYPDFFIDINIVFS